MRTSTPECGKNSRCSSHPPTADAIRHLREQHCLVKIYHVKIVVCFRMASRDLVVLASGEYDFRIFMRALTPKKSPRLHHGYRRIPVLIGYDSMASDLRQPALNILNQCRTGLPHCGTCWVAKYLLRNR